MGVAGVDPENKTAPGLGDRSITSIIYLISSGVNPFSAASRTKRRYGKFRLSARVRISSSPNQSGSLYPPRRYPGLTSRASAIRFMVSSEGIWPRMIRDMVERKRLAARVSWAGVMPLSFNKALIFFIPFYNNGDLPKPIIQSRDL